MASGARQARQLVRTAGHTPADIFSGTSSNWLTCDCSLIQGGLDEYVEDSGGGYVDGSGRRVMAVAWPVPGILARERVVNRTVDGDVLPDTTRSQMYRLPSVT